MNNQTLWLPLLRLLLLLLLYIIMIIIIGIIIIIIIEDPQASDDAATASWDRTGFRSSFMLDGLQDWSCKFEEATLLLVLRLLLL